MSEQNCPVDGCDYQGTADQIKGHMGASTDHPNWSDLDDQVRANLQSGDGTTSDDPDDQAADHPSEGGSDPGSDPPEDDDPPDQDVDQDEPPTDDQNDQPDDSPSDTDMPTPDELDRQRETYNSDDNGGDDDPPESTSRDVSTPSKPRSGGIPLPVSTTTLVMVLALLLVGGLLVAYTRGSSSESDEVEDVQEDVDDQAGSGADEPAPEGGFSAPPMEGGQ